MTIKQLIEELKKFPETMTVYVHNDGCSDDIALVYRTDRMPKFKDEIELYRWQEEHQTEKGSKARRLDIDNTGDEYFYNKPARIKQAVCLFGNDY